MAQTGCYITPLFKSVLLCCISVQHTLKEALKNIQIKSKQILQQQEKKCEHMGKILEQIQVSRSHDQRVFLLFVLCILDTLIPVNCVLNRMKRDKQRTAVKALLPVSSTPSRDITCQWGSWLELRSRRRQLRFRPPDRLWRQRWRKWRRGMLSWTVSHRLKVMSISCRWVNKYLTC